MVSDGVLGDPDSDGYFSIQKSARNQPSDFVLYLTKRNLHKPYRLP